MSHFDYPYTCPQIDKNIELFKGTLRDCLNNFATELCPFLTYSQDLTKFIDDWVESTYSDCSDIFEDVRSSNDSIRTEAENTINKLEDIISDLRYDITKLEE